LLFFSHATLAPEFYTLSLHDALPIFRFVIAVIWLVHVPKYDQIERRRMMAHSMIMNEIQALKIKQLVERGDIFFEISISGHNGKDRKSTRLNSSHVKISYAVFCLKKK